VDERGKQVLQAMFLETDRLNGLVNDLLNVSRIEQGRISYTYEVLDIREVIQTLVDQFGDKAHAKNLEISYAKPAAPVVINVDRGRMIEIMTNLIDNAIKYSQKGTVVVSHKDSKGTATVSVRDTGIGMSSKDRERLFSRFYRIKNDGTKGVPGTGLGLWIIKQYIESMKGSIAVESMEGVGSEFIVGFPLADGITKEQKVEEIT
jgi:signal transduction histidine kinase